MKFFRLLALGALGVSELACNSVNHVLDIPLPIKAARELYVAAKNDIISFYTHKRSNGLTGFETELVGICDQTKVFFEKRTVAVKDTIIFDIDETVLSNLDLVLEENFESRRGTDTNYIFRVAQRCTGIKPMIELCTWLRAKQYKVIFITSRRAWIPGYTEGTVENLKREGVVVDAEDGLFLLEQKYAEGQEKIAIGAWKKMVRDQLRAKGHIIVACIGDDEGDMATAEEVGVKNVKLPNYLY